jgi:ATP-binding cassette subfamily F protein uup
MDRLVDHLFVFEGDGVIRDFPGNYSDYRLSQKTDEKKIVAPPDDTEAAAPVSAKPKEKKKLSFNEKREFEQLEKELPALEKEKAEITEKMSRPNLAYDELQKLSERITEITQLLEEKEMRWLELSEYAN